MIKVTHLNEGPFYVNCEQIEHMEETPDTVITMTSGRKIIVAESAEQVYSLTVDYKKTIHGVKIEE